MREIFEKTVLTTGRCTLSIITPTDRDDNTSGAQLLEDGDSMIESEITPRLLYMLSEAYYAGYKEAVSDATESTRRLLVDNKNYRKPKAKISSCIRYD
jgi:hypothetical protein